jgi:hypothetical protein
MFKTRRMRRARMGENRNAYEVLEETLKESDHWEDGKVDKRIILKQVLKKYDGCVYWINLAQDMDGFWVLLNTEINLQIP